MLKIRKILSFALLSIIAFLIFVASGCDCNSSTPEVENELVDFGDISITAELGDLFDFAKYLNVVDVDGNSYDIKWSIKDSNNNEVECLKTVFEILDRNGYKIQISVVDDAGETLKTRIISVNVVKQDGPMVGYIHYMCGGKETDTICVLKNYTFVSHIEDITGSVSYTATIYPLSENSGEVMRGAGQSVDTTSNSFYVNQVGNYELEIVATDGTNITKRSSFFTATSAINLISFYCNGDEVTEFSLGKTYTYQSLLDETDGHFTYSVTITPISIVYNSETKTYERTNLPSYALDSNSFTFDVPREYLFTMQISGGENKSAECEKVLYCVSSETTDNENYVLIEDFVESSAAACSYGLNDQGSRDKTVKNPTSVWHESVTDKNGLTRNGVISTQSIGDSVNSFCIRSSWMKSADGKEWWQSDKWDYFSFWVYIPSDTANADAVTLAFRGKDAYGRPSNMEIECNVWTEIVWTKQQLGAVMGADANYPQGYPYFCFACDRNNNYNALFVLESDSGDSTQKKDTVVYLDSLAYMKSPSLDISENLYLGTKTAINASFANIEDIDITIKDSDGQKLLPSGGNYTFNEIGIYTITASVEYAGMTFHMNKTLEIIEPIVKVSFADTNNQEITTCSVGDEVSVKANVDGVVDGYDFVYVIKLDGNTFATENSFTPTSSGDYVAEVSVVINNRTFIGEATLSASFENMSFILAEEGVTGVAYPLSASITDRTTGQPAEVEFTYQWSKGDSGWIAITGDTFTPSLGAGTYNVKASATYDAINYEKAATMTVSYQSNVIEDFATANALSAMAVMDNGTVKRNTTNTSAQYHFEWHGRYGVVSATPVSDGATNKSGNDYNIFPISSTIYTPSQIMSIVAGQSVSDRAEYRHLWYTNTDWDYLSIWIYIEDTTGTYTDSTIEVMARYGLEKQIVPMNTWYEFKIVKSVFFSNYSADFEQIFSQNYGLLQLVRSSNAATAQAKVLATNNCRIYFDSISLEKYANEEVFTSAYISEYGSIEEVSQLQHGTKYQLHFFVGETEIAYNKLTFVRVSGTKNAPDWSATDCTFTFAETTSSDDRFYAEVTYTDTVTGKLYRAFIGAAEESDNQM